LIHIQKRGRGEANNLGIEGAKKRKNTSKPTEFAMRNESELLKGGGVAM